MFSLNTGIKSSLGLSLACIMGTALAQPGLPGRTRANVQLQHDALMGVYAAAGGHMTNHACKDIKVVDTLPTSEVRDAKTVQGQTVFGNWDEIWVVNACGQNIHVPIMFMLDGPGAGADYSVKMKDVY